MLTCDILSNATDWGDERKTNELILLKKNLQARTPPVDTENKMIVWFCCSWTFFVGVDKSEKSNKKPTGAAAAEEKAN